MAKGYRESRGILQYTSDLRLLLLSITKILRRTKGLHTGGKGGESWVREGGESRLGLLCVRDEGGDAEARGAGSLCCRLKGVPWVRAGWK